MGKGPQKGKLNRRNALLQRNFARLYLAVGTDTYLNCQQSALAAGYSKAFADKSIDKLLDYAGIQAEMKRIRDARITRSTIASPEEILETLTTVMRTLPNELVNESGELIPLNEMSREQAQAIAGVKVHERVAAGEGEERVIDRRREYKLVDRLKAAEMLARHHGVFELDNRQQAPKALTLVAMPTGEMTLEEWSAQVAKMQQVPRVNLAGA